MVSRRDREGAGGGEGDAGYGWRGGDRRTESQTSAPSLFPPLALFSLFLSPLLSDATLHGQTATATGRVCAVSHTDTGVYTT